MVIYFPNISNSGERNCDLSLWWGVFDPERLLYGLSPILPSRASLERSRLFWRIRIYLFRIVGRRTGHYSNFKRRIQKTLLWKRNDAKYFKTKRMWINSQTYAAVISLQNISKSSCPNDRSASKVFRVFIKKYGPLNDFFDISFSNFRM